MSTTGSDFRHRLEAQGFTAARGDRRDYVLIDSAGEIHGLTRRIEYVEAAQVRERMADLDAQQLLDVATARARLRQRQKAQELEAAKDSPARPSGCGPRSYAARTRPGATTGQSFPAASRT